jgi:hypothetical protein
MTVQAGRYGHAFDARALQVDSIALGSAGCVHERVAVHLEQQLTSHERRRRLLKQADCVIFACHSQGCMVAALVLHRLLADGYIDIARTRCNLLAMAGIHHGPFPDIPTTDFFAASQELFEYAAPESKSFREHAFTVSNLLEQGVKIACVASYGDQVSSINARCCQLLLALPLLPNTHPLSFLPYFTLTLPLPREARS